MMTRTEIPDGVSYEWQNLAGGKCAVTIHQTPDLLSVQGAACLAGVNLVQHRGQACPYSDFKPAIAKWQQALQTDLTAKPHTGDCIQHDNVTVEVDTEAELYLLIRDGMQVLYTAPETLWPGTRPARMVTP
jgi:hypothetical protein